MKKNKLIQSMGAAIVSACLLAAPLGADESKALPQNPNLQDSLKLEADKKVEEKRREVIDDALVALQETFNALKALNEGKKEEALEALAKATGKLELAVARDPNLALAPVDVNMTTFDVVAGPEEIERARREVIKLLEEGDLPTARELLNSLRSEVVVNVAALPLATYPDAIKAVTPLIDEGKIKEAKAALEAALATIVVTRHVIPLPLLRADEALVIAEVLAEKPDRDEKENRVLENALDSAVENLKMAQALGYGTKEDYEILQRQVAEIREKLSGGKSGVGFFDKLKESMNKLKSKVFGDTASPEVKPDSNSTGKPMTESDAK